MPPSIPDTLRALLAADSDGEAEPAWAAFLIEHSGLLLHVARSIGGDDDASMDRYAFMLDALRRDRFLRLRGYTADGRSQFSTWLIVVARRLCLDHYRQRYGRPQGKGREAVERHRERRQLADLLGDELGFEELRASPALAPDAELAGRERTERLQQALARLGPEDRVILRLRFEEGLSVPEVARVLHTGSPFRLYRRIDRILAVLRGQLAAMGIEGARD
jgi:RNA polymerase sigma factor (sigma-70 family)